MNSKLREYDSLLKRLKYLVDRNQGDSENADGIRDLMAECWRSLSDEESSLAESLIENSGLTEEL